MGFSFLSYKVPTGKPPNDTLVLVNCLHPGEKIEEHARSSRAVAAITNANNWRSTKAILALMAIDRFRDLRVDGRYVH